MTTNKPKAEETGAESKADAAAPKEKRWSQSIPDSVDERDIHSLIRAREEYDKASRTNGSRLTAPQLRDFTHFHERVEYILDHEPDIDDPLYFTCQMVLGLVDSEGYRYFDLVKLDNPVPPAARQEGINEYCQKRGNATERDEFHKWPEEYQNAAREFSMFLTTARALYRRCPALVTAKDFPEPFRIAWEQQNGAAGNPDDERADYGERLLFKSGLLRKSDGARTAKKPPAEDTTAGNPEDKD